MEEIWKEIKGFEGLYEVSNSGLVRSKKRATTSGVILKPFYDKDGYAKACLSKNNIRKTYFVHRLVAETFLDGKSKEKNVVNHKNEIKDDNRAENLEWCSVKYNTNYNGAAFRRGKTSRKPVVATKGDETIWFSGVVEAAKALGVSHGNISECIRHRKRHTLKGFSFRWAGGEND